MTRALGPIALAWRRSSVRAHREDPRHLSRSPRSSATDTATGATPTAGTRSRAPLALHAAEGSLTVRIKPNGQVKALSCLFYVSTSRAGQQVHVLWNEQSVEIFTHDGEYLIDYPRPSTTGLYYGPRTARQGTPMKTAGQNPSAGITGTAQRSVSKGGYVGVLASKFYAGYKRSGQQISITWDTTTVTLADTAGTLIATYTKPTEPHGCHGPTRALPSTKS
ncbi:MAG: hypothetical protein ACYC1E_17905 [Propionibacteriaceae bacterium]